jgi:hypothetical protein
MTMLKITESKPIGNTTTFHEVVATLSDGRTASFRNVAHGQGEYPHVGTPVHVCESDYIEDGVLIYHAGTVAIIDNHGVWLGSRIGEIIHD